MVEGYQQSLLKPEGKPTPPKNEKYCLRCGTLVKYHPRKRRVLRKRTKCPVCRKDVSFAKFATGETRRRNKQVYEGCFGLQSNRVIAFENVDLVEKLKLVPEIYRMEQEILSQKKNSFDDLQEALLL